VGIGRIEDATATHKLAATLFGQTGDHANEGKTLFALSCALVQSGRSQESITVLDQYLKLCRSTVDRPGEATALHLIGAVLVDLRRLEEAITASHEAAVIFREIGDHEAENAALTNLATARQALGRP